MTSQWVVGMTTGTASDPQHHIYGPFTDQQEAIDFAAFLTAEVDPAFVWPVRSPTRELLAWRTNVAEQAVADLASTITTLTDHATWADQQWLTTNGEIASVRKENARLRDQLAGLTAKAGRS